MASTMLGEGTVSLRVQGCVTKEVLPALILNRFRAMDCNPNTILEEGPVQTSSHLARRHDTTLIISSDPLCTDSRECRRSSRA